MFISKVINVALLLCICFVFYRFGAKIIVNQLKESDYKNTRKVQEFWHGFVIAATSIFLAELFISFQNYHLYPLDILIVYYLILVFTGIAVVDFLTHDFYLESAIPLVPLPLIGFYYFGWKECLYGILAGLFVSGLISLSEYIIRRTVSYGGGDVVFGIFTMSLVGYSCTEPYWLSISFICLITGLAYLTVQKIKDENQESIASFMIPLLPSFSLVTLVMFISRILTIRLGFFDITSFAMLFHL